LWPSVKTGAVGGAGVGAGALPMSVPEATWPFSVPMYSE